MDASVVVPVHNRSEAFGNCLASLERQSADRSSFEVIVVDDGSSARAAEQVRLACGRAGVTLIRHDRAQGVARARNAGAERAAGEVLIFLDVDCVAHHDLVAEHVAWQRRRPVAVCGWTSARELAPDQWDLLLGADWDFGDPAALFDRVAAEPVLHDPLTELLAEPAASDWSFFWTHNVSVPREAFEQVGGFRAEFEIKGVEDVEFGYRLAKAGVPTVFGPLAKALHQPHSRRRSVDVKRDRRNELIFLAMHTCVEVEAVCSYDIVNARQMAPVLADFAARFDPGSSDCARLAELPAAVEAIAAASSVLLVGGQDGWPARLPPPALACCPRPDDRAGDRAGGRLLPLVGTRLPVPNGSFDLGVVTDYFRLLPERLASRVLGEVARACREVIVLSQVSAAPARQPDSALVSAAERHDRPFWEAVVGLTREFHEFEFSLIERVPGAAAAYRLGVKASTKQGLADVLASPEVTP